jgi:hypothetical protein
MTAESPFPPKPEPSLTREDVVAYLIDLQAKGWTIYTYAENFIVELNETEQLDISPIGSQSVGKIYTVRVQSTVGPSSHVGTPSNMLQFKKAVSPFFENQSPTRARTVEGEPASNFSKIAKLIGPAQVVAVHDPYMDDKGLANLLTLVGLAQTAAPDLRLITSNKGAKGLTRNFVSAFFTQLGCSSGEIRKTSSRKPHRRFMLLSGGQSLIMGMSLNDLDKNEAVHLESDALDRPLFEKEWASSKLL